jgi:hypothetical protein
MGSAKRVRSVVQVVALGLLVAAVAQEAAKPRVDRTWHGRVLGVVPYDFRVPTRSRLYQAYWNPRDARLFTDRVLGVGWAINLHRARVLLSGLFGRLVRDETQPIRLRRPDRG